MPNTEYIFSKSPFMRIDVEVVAGRKTPIFRISESTTFGELGAIKWHTPWRSFCFFPEGECVFDGGCLAKILEWVRAANEQWLRKRTAALVAYTNRGCYTTYRR